MSYKYRVLADSPLGYWRLNEYVLSTYDDSDILYDDPTYEYDQVLDDRLYDETSVSNQGFVSGGSSAIFADVLPLTTSGNSDFAGCKVTDSTVLKIRNRPNKYKMFYSGTENLAFSIEFWLNFDKAPIDINNILTIFTPGHTSAQIFAQSDSIYFQVNGLTESYTAKKQVVRWDSQLHIMASFYDRKIQISVNSISGESVSIPKSFVFNLDNSSSMDVDYQIGPAASGNHFIINDLAFYDYVLSENLIKNHMVWASNDSKPQNYVKETSGFFFDIQDSPLMFDFQKQFMNEQDYNAGVYTDLIADNAGITIQKTASAGTGTTGTWTYRIPSSSFNKISGIKVAWDSGLTDDDVSPNWALVEASFDNGLSWIYVPNASPFVRFDDSSTIFYPNVIIRIKIYSDDTSVKNQPRIDNLFIGVYKDMSIFSDFGAYALSPKTGSYTGDTFAIRNNSFNIMARSSNFGIKLDGTYNPSDQSFNNNSVAVIYPQEQSGGYQTIEFWFRYDENVGPEIIQYILDTVDQEASVYFVPSEKSVYQVGFNAVYINGLDITDQQRSLTQGELYHVVCVYPGLLNSEIYLGSNVALNAHCRATYGFISLYPNQFMQAEAQNRYLSYLTSNTSGVGYNENYVASVAEYAGDTPFLAYNTPTNM